MKPLFVFTPLIQPRNVPGREKESVGVAPTALLEPEDSRELTDEELTQVAGGGCLRFEDTAGCSDNSPPEIHHHNPHNP